MENDFAMQPGMGSDGPPVIVWIIYLAVVGLLLASLWKVFVKAGQPGWACLIPIYNIYILTQIAGRPGWWTVMMLIPCVSIVFALILFIDVAKAFGKGVGYGIGLALLGIVFFPMLAFGDAQYQGAPEHA